MQKKNVKIQSLHFCFEIWIKKNHFSYSITFQTYSIFPFFIVFCLDKNEKNYLSANLESI